MTLRRSRHRSTSCGAEREQWDDGNNFLCVSHPASIFGYERNTTPTRSCARHGNRVVTIVGSELGRGSRRTALHVLPDRARSRLTGDAHPHTTTRTRPWPVQPSESQTSSRRSTSPPRRSCSYLLDLSRDLKRRSTPGTEVQMLSGKEHRADLREDLDPHPHLAFEVGAYDQGAHVTYLDPQSSQMGHKESVADTARVLVPDVRRIEFRGSAHERSRRLPSTPTSRSTTASPTSGTRRRCSPTS